MKNKERNQGFLTALLIVTMVTAVAGYAFVLYVSSDELRDQGLTAMLAGSGVFFLYGAFVLAIVHLSFSGLSAWGLLWRTALIIWLTMILAGIAKYISSSEEPMGILAVAYIGFPLLLGPALAAAHARWWS